MFHVLISYQSKYRKTNIMRNKLRPDMYKALPQKIYTNFTYFAIKLTSKSSTITLSYISILSPSGLKILQTKSNLNTIKFYVTIKFILIDNGSVFV